MNDLVTVLLKGFRGLGTELGVSPGVGRARAPALWATRLALVPLGVAAWVAGGLPGGAVQSAYAAVVAGAAWAKQVGLAVSPIAPVRARPVPFPPELVPAEVMEAAGLDRSGRPKEEA